MESYAYTNDTNDLYQNTKNENFVYKNKEMIAILVFIILLFVLIILFAVFRYVRKRKLIKLFNILNNSLLSDEQNSSSNLIEFNHINDSSDISSLELRNKNINDNNFLLFDKPQLEEEDKNKDVNNYNNINESRIDKETDVDPGLLGQSPAPLFGSTFCSEEDRIKNELSKIKDSTYNPNNNKDEENNYVNTNIGND